MPYRVMGSKVQVQRSSGWETIKTHATRAKALQHLRKVKAAVKGTKHGQRSRKGYTHRIKRK